MPRDARFWRNVTIVAVAHIAIAVTLVSWNRDGRKQDRPSIVWLTGGGTEVASRKSPARKESASEVTPPPETQPPHSREEDQDQPPVPARSDIQLPTATLSSVPVATPPVPKPAVSPVPKAPPRPTAKPTPRATPKKNVTAKATPTPPPKKKVKIAEQETRDDRNKKESETAKIVSAEVKSAEGEESGATGPGGGARGSEFSWYGKMLHDRFHSEWIQPTTSVAAGAKMSALVRIRIEKDGRISKFTVVRPSGNVVVDESVAAVAKRVTQVDPLPNGLGAGAFYEVNITFELDPTQ